MKFWATDDGLDSDRHSPVPVGPLSTHPIAEEEGREGGEEKEREEEKEGEEQKKRELEGGSKEPKKVTEVSSQPSAYTCFVMCLIMYACCFVMCLIMYVCMCSLVA